MDNEIIDLLRDVASSFHMRMKEHILTHDSGLSVFQARLIHLIGRSDGISQLDLVSFTERDKAQVARAIKELETGGFVTRSPRPTDKRINSLTLTAEGVAMHIRLKALRSQLASEALSSLTNDEKHALRAGLKKMATQLGTQQ